MKVIYRSPSSAKHQRTRRPLPQLFLCRRRPAHTIFRATFPLRQRASVTRHRHFPNTPIFSDPPSHPDPFRNPTSRQVQVPYWFHYTPLPGHKNSRHRPPPRPCVCRTCRLDGLVAFRRLQPSRLVRNRRSHRRNTVSHVHSPYLSIDSAKRWSLLVSLHACREETSNNRIRSSMPKDAPRPIDHVPAAGARTGHANGAETTEAGQIGRAHV